MNKRQEKLLNYLIQNKSSRFISKMQIAQELGYVWNENSDRNGREIENDVRKLNIEDTPYIIVSSSEGYKIGNETETNEYLKSIKKRCITSLSLYWRIKKKAETNGNMQFDFDTKTEKVNAIFDD